MLIIGCDYHPSFQQIAFVDTDTGELEERRLEHREEADKFYRELAVQAKKVRVGMEASGQARPSATVCITDRKRAMLILPEGSHKRAASCPWWAQAGADDTSAIAKTRAVSAHRLCS